MTEIRASFLITTVDTPFLQKNRTAQYKAVSLQIKNFTALGRNLAEQLEDFSFDPTKRLTANKISKKWNQLKALLPQIYAYRENVRQFLNKKELQNYFSHRSIRPKTQDMAGQICEVCKKTQRTLSYLIGENILLGDQGALLEIGPKKTASPSSLAVKAIHLTKKTLNNHPLTPATLVALLGMPAFLLGGEIGKILVRYKTTIPYFPLPVYAAFGTAIWLTVPKGAASMCSDLVNSCTRKVTQIFE